jgi:predicted lipid-binding transport protein (Tim44 family)
MPTPDPAREQEEAAAAEAAAIGGRVSSEPPSQDEPDDPAARPLAEAGQGEAEGFEEAERELIEHASHGDLHTARQALEDAPDETDDIRATEAGEADTARSSERED